MPLSNVLLPNLPAIGDVVTFSFESQARKDIPVNPVVYRIRSDVAWEDIVNNFLKEKKLSNSMC